MYLMLTGRPPFNGATDVEVVAKILANQYDRHLLYNTLVSKAAVNLIESLLEPDPDKRISA